MLLCPILCVTSLRAEQPPLLRHWPQLRTHLTTHQLLVVTAASPPTSTSPNLTSMDGRFYQLMNGKWKNANGSAKGPQSMLQCSKLNKSVSVKTHRTKFIPLKKVFKVLFRIPGVFEMFNSFFKYMPTMAGNHSLLPSYICLHTLNILNTTKLAGNNHPGFTDTNSCSPTDRNPWTHHPNETGTDIFCSFLKPILSLDYM